MPLTPPPRLAPAPQMKTFGNCGLPRPRSPRFPWSLRREMSVLHEIYFHGRGQVLVQGRIGVLDSIHKSPIGVRARQSSMGSASQRLSPSRHLRVTNSRVASLFAENNARAHLRQIASGYESLACAGPKKGCCHPSKYGNITHRVFCLESSNALTGVEAHFHLIVALIHMKCPAEGIRCSMVRG